MGSQLYTPAEGEEMILEKSSTNLKEATSRDGYNESEVQKIKVMYEDFMNNQQKSHSALNMIANKAYDQLQSNSDSKQTCFLKGPQWKLNVSGMSQNTLTMAAPSKDQEKESES